MTTDAMSGMLHQFIRTAIAGKAAAAEAVSGGIVDAWSGRAGDGVAFAPPAIALGCIRQRGGGA